MSTDKNDKNDEHVVAAQSDGKGDVGTKANANTAGVLTATKPLSPEDAELDDLLEGPRDLFTVATQREEAASRNTEAPSTDEMTPQSALDDDLFNTSPMDDFTTSAVRELYRLDEESPVERVRSVPPKDANRSAALTGADPLFARDDEAELALAQQVMVVSMGAAADTAAAATERAYPLLPRLHQLCWLGLSGVDQVMRRAAAADVAQALPDMADACLEWMEAAQSSEAERLGLALAGRVDHRAFAAADPSLSNLASGVLLASLQAPLLRYVVLNPARDAIGSQVGSTAASDVCQRAKLRNTGIGALTVDPVVALGMPMSSEAVQSLRLIDAGFGVLPLGEQRISLTEPARRVAAALRDGVDNWGRVDLEVRTRLEQVMMGIGMLLTGATRYQSTTDTSMIRAALEHGQVIVAATVDAERRQFVARIDEHNRTRAAQVKKHRLDAERLERELEEAKQAIAELIKSQSDGRPRTGSSGDRDDAGGAPIEIIVCPELPNSKTPKIRDVILGHEHMLGQPVDLVRTLELQSRRAALMHEFPYALDVIDFILGDLTSKQTVTIRPVLLTGAPGSGKTHFSRRFANHFGLHVWSVDCAGSDGSVFAGTDRRWYSAEPCHPFLAMSRGKQANPLIILDELEKAPTRQDHGRIWDGLLPYLDPGSNKSIQDKALQVPVDCSHINYIATANRVDTLPWPLRDRLRVIAFPEPAPQHLPALMPALLSGLASARSMDPRFIEPLTEEDNAFLARRWKGGSVRRLARMLEAIINARDRGKLKH